MKYKENIEMEIKDSWGGIQILFKKADKTFSAVCHQFSYGASEGLWEIMPPERPKDWVDDVKGYLTFEEVLWWVDKTLL